MKASVVHGKSKVESLERAARELLEIPKLPDGANGPRGRAILAQIQDDERKLGKAATLKKWAHVSTVAHATALDTDPAEHKAASGRTVADLEHPEQKGEYHYPHSPSLDAALKDAGKRAKASAAALAALDDHASKLVELPEDWKAKK